jgi:hypothetical protein
MLDRSGKRVERVMHEDILLPDDIEDRARLIAKLRGSDSD